LLLDRAATLPIRKPKEETMSKLIGPALIVATSMVATSAWSQAPQAPQQAPGFQASRYFELPLEKDASRIVRMQSVVLPSGAGNQFHRHPGDQWWAVQEGEVTFTIKGEAPRLMKAGDSVYVPRGTVHRNQNLSGRPARSIELNITYKDKPQTEQVTN
jgi:quercetin dioxygenase-like cupin family protein